MQIGLRGYFVIPVIFSLAHPHKSCDDALPIYLANTVIVTIGDVHIIHFIHNHIGRISQIGIGGWAVVTPKGMHAVSGKRRYDPPAIHLTNAVITPVGNIEIAVTVKRNSKRIFQQSIYGETKITTKTWQTVSCHSGDNSILIYFANAAV